MAKGSFKLGASSKAVDPTLSALFSTSSGPVKPNAKSKYSELLPPQPEEDDEEEEEGVDEDEDEDMEDADGPDAASDSDAEEEVEEKPLPPPKKSKDRKRKREEADDLESRYLNKLADEEVKEGEKMKKQKKEQKKEQKLKEAEAKKQEDDDTSSEEEEDAEDKSDDDNAAEVGGDDEDTPEEDEDASSDEIPVHESILAAKSKEAPAKDDEVEKANRTVFLSNVAAEATTSKTAKKTLMDHLSTVLADDEKIESIRFRSLAFSTGALPKRAAYITQSIMESTTKSANAYVVYSSPSGARKAFAELNGTVVLDRHLRVDSVAHPSPVDHRRCVFVGNLGFVDDETVINTNSAGETSTRKRTKIPSDTEEGLWQTFGKHAGKVENVRVVRDPKTRVGKGFAYVQFYDENDVEAALLLNGKKYPPMLPRILRVVRAKAPHKTALAQEQRKAKAAALAGVADKAKKSTKYKHKATPEQQSSAGRAAKLLGRAGGFREVLRASGKDDRRPGKKGAPAPHGNGSGVVPKTPEQFIFEGRRASANDGRPNDVKIGGKKKGRVGKKGRVEKPGGRGTARAEAWKKQQKKKD